MLHILKAGIATFFLRAQAAVPPQVDEQPDEFEGVAKQLDEPVPQAEQLDEPVLVAEQPGAAAQPEAQPEALPVDHKDDEQKPEKAGQNITLRTKR
ncbi:MAG: hypothetical protein Q3M30_00895 [Candidatus Electrothrix sp. Rat3]|nr:hypothetical protein [Candidatus Electrothrix rattekaaiensis]